MKYFCKIRFLGTHFCGFQFQPELRTVQGSLTEIMKDFFGVPCKITGCSRTDSGVHAEEFCITVEPTEKTAVLLPAERLPKAISPFLPEDISLYEAKMVEDSFHVRYDARGKEYVYRVDNAAVKNPFWTGRAWQFFRPISDTALEKMQLASRLFVGMHDFSSFRNPNTQILDTVRTVTDFSIQRKGDLIEFSVSADGFLYNMVRIMVGTLMELAFSDRPPEAILEILQCHDRTCAGMTAPPEGLYLHRVFYHWKD